MTKEKSGWKMPELNNQTLLIIVGVLAVVLIALVIVSVNLDFSQSPEPTQPQLSSDPTTEATVPTTPSTGATQPTQPTTQPTQPTTQPIIPTVPPAPPEGGKYINVGYGHLAEVIQAKVETFDGGTYDDFSHPTNNYLPEGTVD